MPITRALSSRLRPGSRRQSTTTTTTTTTTMLDSQTKDLTLLKNQAKAAVAVEPQVGRALVASALAQLNVQNAGKGSSCSSYSTGSTGSVSTTSASSRPRYTRGAGRLSSRASTSSRRSMLGSSELGDSSDDDDDENDDRRPSRRLGGCSSRVGAAGQPDDSNKENVAPFRCTSQHVLDAEARDAQHEDAIRRTTRSRRSSLMERQAFSSPAAPSPRLSRSSTTSDLSVSHATSMPRTPSRRLTRTASEQHFLSSSPSHRSASETTPTRRPSALSASGRKRSRNDADFEADDAAMPASPLSRLRLHTPTTRRHATHLLDSPTSSRFSALATPDEEAGSYFPLSSQDSAQSSLFDTHSIADSSSAPTSSCSSDRDVSPPSHAVALKSASQDKYSSVYAHARALLRYAAGVDPAETEAGLTITGATTATLGEHHVKVVGRESERVAIQLFLQNTFGLFPDAPQRARSLGVELDGDSDAACLYVCGLPGTGKTALVRSVLNSLSDATTSSVPARSLPRVAFVNCMTLAHPRLIFGKVLQALGSDAAEGQSDAVAEHALSTLIREGNQRILIVLDEMDHLLQSRAHQNILYKIFSWASACSGASRGAGCSLIGIANSLDLTERFVPLLASKGASPALLHFRPFEAQEIVSVIRDRLSGLDERYDEQEHEQPEEPAAQDALPLFTPTAVELLAKKIAGATGDLRKALDAARLAVEMVENEQRKKAVAAAEAERAKAASAAVAEAAEVADAASGAGIATSESEEEAVPATTATAVRAAVLSHLTPRSAAKVTPTQILKVLTAVLGSPNLSKVRGLGVHPKLVLLAVLVAQARTEQGLSVLGSATSGGAGVGGGAMRIADVESTYHAILRQENGLFSPLEGSELLGVFDMLEVNGVLRISSEVEAVTTLKPQATLGGGGSSVSPSGKRAAKKQLLASSRKVYLAMAAEDVQRGITTAAPAGVQPGMGGGSAVAETIARVYAREKDRALKAKLYHSIAQENARIRQEELGGGRMALPLGSF